MVEKYGPWDTSRGRDDALGDVEVKHHRDNNSDVVYEEVVGVAADGSVRVIISNPSKVYAESAMTRLLTENRLSAMQRSSTAGEKSYRVTTVVSRGLSAGALVREAAKIRDMMEALNPSDQKVPRRYIGGRLARPNVGKDEIAKFRGK